MSSGKNSNNDSCRDLNGRRLSSIKEAQRLSEYLESAATRDKAEIQAAKDRLADLERQLGISPGQSGAGPSTQTKADLEEVAKKRHRFDDHEFLEESREINDNVRNAVSAGEFSVVHLFDFR